MSSSPLQSKSSQEAQATSPLKAFPHQSSAGVRSTHHNSVRPVVPPHTARMDSRQHTTTKEPEIELFVKVGRRGDGQ